VDGVVLRRIRESESVVPQGEPLIEVGDVAKLEIVADYLSTDAVQMEPGQRVVLERSRDAWTRLGDQYRVEVRVVVWSSPDVLRVPVSALVRHGDAWSVFAVERGRAKARPVSIGARNDRFAELRSGLAEGATVVAFPGDRISDGIAVATR
jgi:HlyD family secretion protein